MIEQTIGFLICYGIGTIYGIHAVYWATGAAFVFLFGLRLITGKWQHLID